MIAVLIDQVIAGRYRITELIGQGGMGTVFGAVHTGTGARVALKLIVSKDVKEEVFVRFQREARAAGAVDSHHIARVFDMGTDERSGSPFMVMERLYGEDLAEVMKRVGPMAPPLALWIASQAAVGLAKAHDAGIVHRDIKPANLFLHDGDRGEIVVKLLDFGIAKVLMDTMQRAEEGGLTRTGSMLGSPHYMSPEQAQGLRTIDHRSDVWSLGVVLYKMLTGQTPHAHLQTLGQVILAICSQPARPVQQLAPWVPAEIAAIVHRALMPDPGQRFQTAHEMFAAMQPLLGGFRSARRADIAPLSQVERARVATPPIALRDQHGHTHDGVSHAATTAPRTSGASRSTIIAAMVGAVVLAAIGIAGIGAGVAARQRGAGATGATASSQPEIVAVTSAATSASTEHAPSLPPNEDTAPPETPPLAPAAREVTLTVTPANAVVEVDGERRESVDGVVTLSGPPGAVVTVRVTAGGGEVTQRVAITEGGAIPPRIAVAKANGHHGASPSGRTPQTASTATGVNVQRNFE